VVQGAFLLEKHMENSTEDRVYRSLGDFCAEVVHRARLPENAELSPYTVAFNFMRDFSRRVALYLAGHQAEFQHTLCEGEMLDFFEVVAMVARERRSAATSLEDIPNHAGVYGAIYDSHLLGEALGMVEGYARRLRDIYVRQVNGYPMADLSPGASKEDLKAKKKDAATAAVLEKGIEQMLKAIGFRTVCFQDNGGHAVAVAFSVIEKPYEHSYRFYFG
jgi:hypothetical protein